MENQLCKFSNHKPWYEILLLFVNAIIPITAICIGLIQFNKKQEFNKTVEFKRSIWSKQLDSYTQIAELAGKIASENDITKFRELANEFESQYWGKMILFEDSIVVGAMKAVRKEIDDKKNGIKDEDNPFRLNASVLLFVTKCKESLNNARNILSK